MLELLDYIMNMQKELFIEYFIYSMIITMSVFIILDIIIKFFFKIISIFFKKIFGNIKKVS